MARPAGAPRRCWYWPYCSSAPARRPRRSCGRCSSSDQPITDILLALGQISGRSIVPDETVSGSASFYFAETDFETALQLFLQTYKLFHVRDGSIYYVSRVRTDFDAGANVLSMDAEDVKLPLLVRAASRALGRTILTDPLPDQTLSVHVNRVPPEKLLEIMLKRFPEFRLETDADYFFIRRLPAAREGAAGPAAAPRGVWVQRKEDLYSLRLDKGRFQEVLDDLFQKGGHEYSLLARRDIVLENLRFEGKGFEQPPRLILEQASADFTRVGELYYIYEIQQRDVLKKLKTTVRIPLRTPLLEGPGQPLPGRPDVRQPVQDRHDRQHHHPERQHRGDRPRPGVHPPDRPAHPGPPLLPLRSGATWTPSKLGALLPPGLKGSEPVVVPGTGSVVLPLSPEGRDCCWRSTCGWWSCPGRWRPSG